MFKGLGADVTLLTNKPFFIVLFTILKLLTEKVQYNLITTFLNWQQTLLTTGG